MRRQQLSGTHFSLTNSHREGLLLHSIKATTGGHALVSAAGRSMVVALHVIVIFFAVSLAAQQVLAATYYVDGACASSGTGTTLNCGANGPFQTIMQGISVLAADARAGSGGTLNIRGAHNSFNGVYNEYLGLWGNNALQCTASQPCTVQGYQSEVPTISALVRRTDWTNRGGGIWSRTMETRTEYLFETPGDNQNPYHLHEGANKATMPYGTSTTPPEGKWFYSSGTVYVHPTGGVDPNTTAQIWVPDKRILFEHRGWQNDCPSTPNCPVMSYVTFRNFLFEGARYINFEVGPGYAGGINWVLNNITCRFSSKHCMVGSRFTNLTAINITVENTGQGLSSNLGGTFGFRFFHIDGGTLSNLTAQNAGNSSAPWMASPWDSTQSSIENNGNGIEVKQSRNVTVTNLTCQDLTFECFKFDSTHLSTLDTASVEATRFGVVIDEYTPDAAPYNRTHDITIKNAVIDNVGWNDSGSIMVRNLSALSAGEIGVTIENSIVSRSCYGSISVDDSDKVSIYNNTIWQDRMIPGGCSFAALATTGILLTGTNNDLAIKNNIIKDVALSGIEVSPATTTAKGLSIDYNLYHNGDGNMQCIMRWGSTCYTSLASFVSAKGFETHGIEGNPLLANPAGGDFRPTSTSPVIDAGVNVGLPFVGSAPDIGAFELNLSSSSAPLLAPTGLTVILTP
jgi:Right handed beta helix region